MWLARNHNSKDDKMKKPKDVEGLADSLTAAASMPAGVTAEVYQLQARPQKVKRTTKSVFLRLDAELYERYDREAIARTKATGRGVTVQQVILSRLQAGDA